MNNKALITKYIFILAISYAAEYGLNLYLRSITPELSRTDLVWVQLIPTILTILFNGVTAIILYSDVERLKLRAPYAVLCSVLFRPVGVCGFLLYAIIHDRTESLQEPIDGILDR